jgi:purine-binding chemotaxis protein CheW
VPLAPGAIAGVLNLRGRIVTVIDMRRVLAARGDFQDGQSLMSVTVDHKGDLYTLLVDAIGDVRSFPASTYEKPPTTLDENLKRVCAGILRLEDALLVVLDVDRILSEETLARTPPSTRRRLRLKSDARNHSTRKEPASGADKAAAALGAVLSANPVLKALFSGEPADRLAAKTRTLAMAAFAGVGVEDAFQALMQGRKPGDDQFIALASAFHGALTEAGAKAEAVDAAMAQIDRLRVTHYS